MAKLLEFLDRHTARNLFRSSHLKTHGGVHKNVICPYKMTNKNKYSLFHIIHLYFKRITTRLQNKKQNKQSVVLNNNNYF